MYKKEKVVIALSGGVDSAVAAWKLVSDGYDVLGVHFELWNWTESDTEKNRKKQKIHFIGKKIGFPVVSIDARDKFKSFIVDDFIVQLERGLTPNPCVRCNPLIKFQLLEDYANKQNAEKIATGHYTVIREKKDGTYGLFKSIDKQKDQSYFLGYLTQQLLSRTILPLGNTEKKENVKIAGKLDLPINYGEESQDLCFLNQSDYEKFVSNYSPDILEPGEIINTRGDVIGRHRGLALFTIGQRKGIRIPAEEPLYVIRKDTLKNQLIVGPLKELGMRKMAVSNLNWVSGKEITDFECKVKIRYRSKEKSCHGKKVNSHRYVVEFQEKIRDITPGQFAVFYDGQEVLGAGVIQEAFN